MLDAFLFLPIPRFLAPQRGVLIATRLNKPQEILVRDVPALDRKFSNVLRMCLEFVIPPELFARFILQPKVTLPAGISTNRDLCRAVPELAAIGPRIFLSVGSLCNI